MYQMTNQLFVYKHESGTFAVIGWTGQSAIPSPIVLKDDKAVILTGRPGKLIPVSKTKYAEILGVES